MVLLRLGCTGEGTDPAMVNPVTSCFLMLLFQLVMVPRACVVMSQKAWNSRAINCPFFLSNSLASLS